MWKLFWRWDGREREREELGLENDNVGLLRSLFGRWLEEDEIDEGVM